MPVPKREWDPRNKEDCKHIIRQVLDREPTAGEVMMFTIRLHLERLETIPRITDAAQRLQRTAEYRYCTAAWGERAGTRPAVLARSPEAAPRRCSVALPEEAEQAAAERAIRALLAGVPADFSVLGHNTGKMVPEILQTLDEAEVLALRNVCENGRELAEQVRDYTENSSYTIISTGQVFDTEGYLMDVLPDLDAEERAQAQLHRAICHLAWEAHHDQIGGPVLKDARGGQDDLEWLDVGSTALGAVEAAVRMLGPEADATAVRREAIGRMMDSMTDDEREGKDLYQIGIAIKHLVNVRNYPNGILDRVKRGHPPVFSLAQDDPR